MIDRLSADAAATLANAQQTAKELGRDSIDSAMLLLGMLATPASTAARMLGAEGVSAVALLDMIAERWPLSPMAVVTGDIPEAVETSTILADARKLSQYAGAEEVTTAHLLLALVRMRECLGAQLLWACTADLDAFEAAINADDGDA